MLLPYTLWHAGVTVDSCHCGIMQCCIVLKVFRAIVAEVVYHCVSPYAL